MSKTGRTPNVMPSLNEANVEDLLKLKTMLEQSIDQGKPQSDSGKILLTQKFYFIKPIFQSSVIRCSWNLKPLDMSP